MLQPAPGVFYAGNGPRFIAWVVDEIILGVVATVILVVFMAIAAAASSNDSTAIAGATTVIAIGGFLVVSIFYLPWFWGHGGQTPGMRLLHVRVVRANDGGPLTVRQALVRLVGYWISGAVFYLGFIWILFDPRRQGWHDKIATTVVIQVP